jgi:hypothetical protein
MFVTESLVGVARGMFEDAGVSLEEAERRIVVIGDGWLGSTAKSADAAKPLVRMEELLGLGKLVEEEKFAGKAANEVVYLCYSSGMCLSFHS